MNINELKSIAEIMTAHSLTLVELEEKGIKIKLEKAQGHTATVIPSFAPVQEPAQVALPKEKAVEVPTQGHTVKCPTVGVYYSSSSPDTAPYVSMGSKVKVGDTLCIIEAMKLMNEITADCEGEIVEVCVGNGQVVEYGQPLFRIK